MSGRVRVRRLGDSQRITPAALGVLAGLALLAGWLVMSLAQWIGLEVIRFALGA